MSELSASSTPPALPIVGVLLGIDYGTKRVGVAVSDREQKFSSPLFNHDRQGIQGDERFFRKVVAEYRPVGIVVGLPIHLSGDESQKSREARDFAAWLTALSGLPHTFQDERFTSHTAELILLQAELTRKQRKARMDKLSAQILLQTFLDKRAATRPTIQPQVATPSATDYDEQRQSNEPEASAPGVSQHSTD